MTILTATKERIHIAMESLAVAMTCRPSIATEAREVLETLQNALNLAAAIELKIERGEL